MNNKAFDTVKSGINKRILKLFVSFTESMKFIKKRNSILNNYKLNHKVHEQKTN